MYKSIDIQFFKNWVFIDLFVIIFLFFFKFKVIYLLMRPSEVTGQESGYAVVLSVSAYYQCWTMWQQYSCSSGGILYT